MRRNRLLTGMALLCLSIIPSVPKAQSGAAAISFAESGLQPSPAQPSAAQASSAEIQPAAEGADPFLAAVLGALPLASGYYLTSTPQKGLVFTLADAMLIGAIVRIRMDSTLSQGDVHMYYALLGAVNVGDLILSVLQARKDLAARLIVNLNPSNRPGLALGWKF